MRHSPKIGCFYQLSDYFNPEKTEFDVTVCVTDIDSKNVFFDRKSPDGISSGSFMCSKKSFQSRIRSVVQELAA